MKNFINFIVKDNEKDIRIDLFLSKKNKKLSRTRIKSLILDQNLKINNKIIIDPSKKISKGDKIIFEILEEKKNIFKTL